MKKQLLFIFLAFFAATNLFGQVHSDPPTCSGTPLTPAVGAEYEYTVTIPGNEGYDAVDGTYEWFIVQAPVPFAAFDLLTRPVIASGVDFIVTPSGGTYATYDDPLNEINPIRITWQSAALTNGQPYYLVIRYKEQYVATPASLCTTDNVKAYLITPQNTFWLKIENIADALGAVGGDEICSPNVVSSQITTAGGNIEYDFGTTTHYLKITANGYTGDFTPSLRTTVLPVAAGDPMDYTSITWVSGTANGTFTESAVPGIWTSNNPMPSLNTYNTATSTWGTGQEIFVTIVIDHNNKELLTDLNLAFAIDGTFTSGGITYNDKWDDGTTDCVDEPAYGDEALRVLRARPAVNPTAPLIFVPGNNVP